MAEDYTPYSGAYTGAQIDSILAKANASESYTTAEKTKLSTLFNYDDTLVKADISDLKDDKVDKVSGKSLSTNDYTTAEKNKLASLSNYDDSEVRSLIAGKVDKVSDKGLSTNDYTTAEKTKLASLENYDDSGVYAEINKRIPDTMGEPIIDPDPDNGVYANLFNLPIGKYNRQSNASRVQNVPNDLGNTAFYCEITNTVSNLRREILLFPCTASSVGTFYRCIETSSGFTSWYKFDGEVVT